MTNSEVLIKVENVSKKFCRRLKRSLWYGMKDLSSELIGRSNSHKDLRKDEFWAVDDVTFELKRGECLGLIGPNGSGKSTLLKMLNGLIKPDKGKITMRGRVGALIELGTGFNPILTGRENIYINGSVLGFTEKEISKKFESILEFADIGEFIDTPVQNYSSGMKVRLGFAVAAHMEPDILIVDEVLAVGDVGFRHKCHNMITELTMKCAVIVVSHSMPSIARVATGILLLNKGHEIYLGNNMSTGIEKLFDLFPVEKTRRIGEENVLLNSCHVHGTKNHSSNIQYLDDIIIDIEFSFLKEDCSDFLMFNIFNIENVFLAETYVEIPRELRTINKTCSISVKISKNHFSTGNYSIVLVFCKKRGEKVKGEYVSQYRPAVCFDICQISRSWNLNFVFGFLFSTMH